MSVSFKLSNKNELLLYIRSGMLVIISLRLMRVVYRLR